MNQLEIFENRDSSTPWQTNLQAALLGYSSMESSVAETETLAQFNNTPHVNTEIQSLSEHIQRMNYSRLVQNLQTTKNFGNLAQYQTHHLTGPIQFIRNLLNTWNLEQKDAVFLLGFEVYDQHYVRKLLDGYTPLMGRDIKDRIAYLFQIRGTLSVLFQSEDVENEWLREKHTMLNDQKPLELLLDGTMENLLLIKDYVNIAAGR